MFNIFFLVFFAMVLGILLAVFVTRSSTPSKESYLLPEEDAAVDLPDAPLTMADLQQLIELICKDKTLTIREKVPESETESYWIADHPDPLFAEIYVFGAIIPTKDHPLVPLAKVLEFKDFVKGAGSTNGLLLAGGYFSRDVHQPLEGVKVQLLNRKKIIAELKKRS